MPNCQCRYECVYSSVVWQIHRLWVTSDDGRVLGVVTLSDIVHCLVTRHVGQAISLDTRSELLHLCLICLFYINSALELSCLIYLSCLTQSSLHSCCSRELCQWQCALLDYKTYCWPIKFYVHNLKLFCTSQFTLGYMRQTRPSSFPVGLRAHAKIAHRIASY